MKNTIILSDVQGSPIDDAAPASSLQYHAPRVTMYGLVAELTKGSGGDYEDECTSGKWPGDDDDKK
jgi:hypothetical protein